MADWTDIPDATFEPGAPAKGRDMRFLRDNPIAIAEGAPGAPRIAGQQSPAIRNGGIPNGEIGSEKFQSGTDERDWVLARVASSSRGAVGTYALLRTVGPGAETSGGSTRAGSSLVYYSTTGSGESHSGENPSGTWRNMGHDVIASTSGGAEYRNSLWLRIS